MAYSTTAPPSLTNRGPLTGAGQQWVYRTTADVSSDVDGAGYITDAQKLGVRAGDIMLVFTATAWTRHAVMTVTSTGADLSDGTTFGSTANND